MRYWIIENQFCGRWVKSELAGTNQFASFKLALIKAKRIRKDGYSGTLRITRIDETKTVETELGYD